MKQPPEKPTHQRPPLSNRPVSQLLEVPKSPKLRACTQSSIRSRPKSEMLVPSSQNNKNTFVVEKLENSRPISQQFPSHQSVQMCVSDTRNPPRYISQLFGAYEKTDAMQPQMLSGIPQEQQASDVPKATHVMKQAPKAPPMKPERKGKTVLTSKRSHYGAAVTRSGLSSSSSCSSRSVWHTCGYFTIKAHELLTEHRQQAFYFRCILYPALVQTPYSDWPH